MDKETKQQRFKEKTEKRVGKILSSFEILSCFSNRQLYEYSALEVMAMFSKIETAMNEARKSYIYELQREEGTYYIDEEDEEFDEDELI